MSFRNSAIWRANSRVQLCVEHGSLGKRMQVYPQTSQTRFVFFSAISPLQFPQAGFGGFECVSSGIEREQSVTIGS